MPAFNDYHLPPERATRKHKPDESHAIRAFGPAVDLSEQAASQPQA
ncbi:MAG TPA: hypothetical protein VGB17_13130 [Pyrinomonadaceae bacterium]